MSSWIEYVKYCQSQYECSYKDALSIASQLRKKQQAGKGQINDSYSEKRYQPQKSGGMVTKPTQKMIDFYNSRKDAWNEQPKTDPIVINKYQGDLDVHKHNRDVAQGMEMALNFL